MKRKKSASRRRVKNLPIDSYSLMGDPDALQGYFEMQIGGTMTVGGGGLAVAGGGTANPAAVGGGVVLSGAGVAVSVHGASVTTVAAARLLAMFADGGSGSYTTTHESGNTYHGKGSQERSNVSGRRIENETGDRHVATDWKPSATEREAFKDEARRIRADGGVDNPNNYNPKKNSSAAHSAVELLFLG